MALRGGSGSPSNTMWLGSRPTYMPIFILIHPTIWPQYTNVTDRQTDRQDNGPIAYGELFYKWSPKTPTLFHKQIFHFNFGMPFDINNFVIRTGNFVLVSERHFVPENVVFVSEICVSVVEEQSVLEILPFHFQNDVKLWYFAIWFYKMSQTAISFSESGLCFEI